jgi:hypothetical protein
MSKDDMPFIVLADALPVIKALEISLQETGLMHCALAGSLIYKGFSNKDIDIIIYARKEGTSFPTPELLNSCLVASGLRVATRNSDSKHPTTILNSWTKLGQKVDLFFFDFLTPTEDELKAYESPH